MLTSAVPFPIELIHCWMDLRSLSTKEKLLTREVKFEVMLLAVVVVVFPARISACQCLIGLGHNFIIFHSYVEGSDAMLLYQSVRCIGTLF